MIEGFSLMNELTIEFHDDNEKKKSKWKWKVHWKVLDTRMLKNTIVNIDEKTWNDSINDEL